MGVTSMFYSVSTFRKITLYTVYSQSGDHQAASQLILTNMLNVNGCPCLAGTHTMDY